MKFFFHAVCSNANFIVRFQFCWSKVECNQIEPLTSNHFSVIFWLTGDTNSKKKLTQTIEYLKYGRCVRWSCRDWGEWRKCMRYDIWRTYEKNRNHNWCMLCGVDWGPHMAVCFIYVKNLCLQLFNLKSWMSERYIESDLK